MGSWGGLRGTGQVCGESPAVSEVDVYEKLIGPSTAAAVHDCFADDVRHVTDHRARDHSARKREGGEGSKLDRTSAASPKFSLSFSCYATLLRNASRFKRPETR